MSLKRKRGPLQQLRTLAELERTLVRGIERSPEARLAVRGPPYTN